VIGKLLHGKTKNNRERKLAANPLKDFLNYSL